MNQILPRGVVQEISTDPLSERKSIKLRILSVDEMHGERYEDTYGEYMKLFEYVARIPRNVEVTICGAPWSWHPLLIWMGCKLQEPVIFFDHDYTLVRAVHDCNHFDRTFVEVMCGFRPECADALWKLDMQWQTERNRNEKKREFIVTNNGSFHRAEVLEFRKKLAEYTPEKRDVVLVPCAADKPYPSPLHKAVLARMPESFYLCNATGVLGLVPQDLWPAMPYYDSGIPNEWRLMNTVMDYFTRVPHRHVVVYCDFYSEAVDRGLSLASIKAGKYVLEGKHIYVNPVTFYYDYVDLLAPQKLKKLEEAFEECLAGK